MLANIYLHHAVDVWFEEIVKVHCRGAAYRCRYADDFACAFEPEADAERFYRVLGGRLGSFGLEVAEDKTNRLRFSRLDWKKSGTFEFLGFEFRWGRGRWGKPALKRRTSRKKYRASLASFQTWCHEHCRKRKEKFFAALNAKLRGYYNYDGIRGNFESIDNFFYQVTRMLSRQLNRRSQRRSYNWKGFADRNRVLKTQSEKTRKREPVADLIFHLLVSQVVQRLQNQHLEHQHHVERLAARVGFAFLLGHRLPQGTKDLHGIAAVSRSRGSPRLLIRGNRFSRSKKLRWPMVPLSMNVHFGRA